MPTPDYTRRALMSSLGPYEGILATVIGVEHTDRGPGRRRIVAVATDQRVLVAHVRDPAHPERIPYAQLRSAEVIHDADGAHLSLATRDGEHRIDAVRDPDAAEIFAAMAQARAGVPGHARQPKPSRVRLLSS